MHSESDPNPISASTAEAPSLPSSLVNVFRATYPVAFSVPPKPLELGVTKLLIAAFESQMTPGDVRRAMRWYCGRHPYLLMLARGGPRHALDGRELDVVSEEHRRMAQTRLESSRMRQRIERIEYDKRRKLLHWFQSQDESIDEFARRAHVPVEELKTQLSVAETEQQQRRERRLRLVNTFRESGLSPEEFCRTKGITAEELSVSIKKISRVAAAPS
jgi:sRNA-binding protein